MIRALLWPLFAVLAGCATAAPRQEVVIYRGCDDMDHATVVDVKVGFPALECAALAAQEGAWIHAALFVVGFPALGCVFVYPEDDGRISQATMWLYPVNFTAIVEHEMEHAKRKRDLLGFLPIAVSDCAMEQPI